MRFLYRGFRRAKAFVIRANHPSLSRPFFALADRAERLASARKASASQRQQRAELRRRYLARFSADSPPFLLRTAHPLAVTSDDHRFPRGTLNDNSLNRRFNRRLYELLGHKADLKLLDLGCSGGAFVRSVIEDGHTAVGLEGSDVSRRLQTGEWGTIPFHLFTCDITRPFEVTSAGGERVAFDVVTAWEVLEHIPKDLIASLVDNIHAHLRPGGYFIGSVATFPDANPLRNAVYHVTLESRSWWLDQFIRKGFREVTNHGFMTPDWVRGSGLHLTDWSPEDGAGFHMVVQKI
jgi:SAM-dependent methyltransferase